jgi:phosphate/sulfate permease
MHVDTCTLCLLVIILMALTFDFLNGFHDAANSIAAVVSTRVLSPRKAAVCAAFFVDATLGVAGRRIRALPNGRGWHTGHRRGGTR